MITIDANIAVKWYLPEADSPRALTLFNDPTPLVAPALIRTEVCSAITRRVREQQLTEPEAREHCREWLDDLRNGVVRMVPDEELLPQAIELSLTIRHALLDSFYLAVAQQHKIPLLTADGTFQKRAVKLYPETHLLSHWKTH